METTTRAFERGKRRTNLCKKKEGAGSLRLFILAKERVAHTRLYQALVNRHRFRAVNRSDSPTGEQKRNSRTVDLFKPPGQVHASQDRDPGLNGMYSKPTLCERESRRGGWGGGGGRIARATRV